MTINNWCSRRNNKLVSNVAHINTTTLIWLLKVSTIWWCHISCSGNRKSCTGSGLDQKRPTIAQKWQIWIPIWCQFGSSRPCDPGSRFRVLHFQSPTLWKNIILLKHQNRTDQMFLICNYLVPLLYRPNMQKWVFCWILTS